MDKSIYIKSSLILLITLLVSGCVTRTVECECNVLTRDQISDGLRITTTYEYDQSDGFHAVAYVTPEEINVHTIGTEHYLVKILVVGDVHPERPVERDLQELTYKRVIRNAFGSRRYDHIVESLFNRIGQTAEYTSEIDIEGYTVWINYVRSMDYVQMFITTY